MKVIERLLAVLGGLLALPIAPFVALGSWLKRERFIHSPGTSWDGTVHAVATSGPASFLAERLKGKCTVRFSAVLGRNEPTKKDILGLAVRFRWDGERAVVPRLWDQDVLTASMSKWWGILSSLRDSDVLNVLSNEYLSLLPLQDPDLGTVEFRVRCKDKSMLLQGEGRGLDLGPVMDERPLRLELDVRAWGGKLAWQRCAELELEGACSADPQVLRYTPFRTGRGVTPTGFLNGMRAVIYPASQLGRMSFWASRRLRREGH